MIQPFLKAVPLLTELENAGYEAYFVGGAIRDYLLDRSIADVDIATSAKPAEVKSVFSNTVDIGIEHGTVLVLFKGTPYELTTFRTEAEYSDFRRPDKVTFVRSLTEDLRRRDFTMNAIAMDRGGSIIDPFDGRKAISERKIETVGAAADRFSEDALRMLRALRFVSQLSFEIEAETLKALTRLAPLMANIAVERKTAEFEKLLTGKSRCQSIELLINTEVYKYMPGIAGFKNNLVKLSHQPCSDLSNMEMWLLLLHYLELGQQEAESFLREWKLPSKKIKTLLHHQVWLKYRLENEWSPLSLYHSGRVAVRDVERVFHVIRGNPISTEVEWLLSYDALPIKQRSDINVSGSELIARFGKPGGPWLKELLGKLETAILQKELNNNPAEIKEWLAKCNLSSEKN